MRTADRLLVTTANPGGLLAVSTGARRERHLRVRRQGCADGGDLGHRGVARADAGRDSRRGAHAFGQHAHAGRCLERLVGALRQRRRVADHEPEGPLPAVARGPLRQGRLAGPDVRQRGVSAAQRAARGELDHGSPGRRGLPEAVLDRRGRDCRLRRGHRRTPDGQHAGGTPSGSPPRLAAAPIKKGCRRSSGRPRTKTATSCLYDVMYRREGETSWKLLKGGLTDSILVWDTASAPNGAYVVKVVASDQGSNPAETALKGERESAQLRRRQQPAGGVDRHAPARRRQLRRALLGS